MKTVILWRTILIGSLYALVLYLFAGYSQQGEVVFHREAAWMLLYLVLAVTSGAALLIMLTQKLDQAYFKRWKYQNRFAYTLLLNVLFLAAWSVPASWIYCELFHFELSLREFLIQHRDTGLRMLILLFISTIIYTLADFAMFAFRRYYLLKLESEQAIRHQTALRFNALKSQLRPHFLFNSFNTVSSLVYRDVQETERFIRNLARAYRSVLKNYDHSLIPLREEMKLVRAYIYLMRVRFEGACSEQINIPEECLDLQLPPLSLQMLVENAFKHNQLSTDNPLNLEIFIRNNSIHVRNNYIGMPRYLRVENDLVEHPAAGRPSPGLGLTNIRQRYRLLTSREVRVSKNSCFEVILPLITA